MATVLKGEGAVIEALRGRFPPPAWALLTGVMNGTGRHANRTVDALGMSLYPSRGLELVGFEVKVTRGDWLRELGNPEKAEAVGAYCDRWFIAAGTKDIVKVEELPGPWGLLVPHGKTMKIVKDASRLDAKPLDRKFLAAILRRLSEQRVDPSYLKTIREEECEKAQKAARSDGRFDLENAQVMVEQLKTELHELRKLVPSEIRIWSPSQLKKALAAARRFSGYQGLLGQANTASSGAQTLQRGLEGFLSQIKSLIAFANEFNEEIDVD